ncbi:MAG TPA: class I SAM-dependent methyltransferase [Syntrophorhabdaceae bacterium]|nr:class I SAM-dependent methyltransferase [Syntrophorhabdaceae bacterium]
MKKKKPEQGTSASIIPDLYLGRDDERFTGSSEDEHHVNEGIYTMTSSVKPFGAGRSSFEFVDTDLVLHALALTPSTVFVDLGCGKGNYTLAVASTLQSQGRVYGIDAWQEGLDELRERAARLSLKNIITIQANLNEHIPIEDGTADICFMATVLHDLLRDSTGNKALSEIARVLKPTGRIGIIEFKKIEDGPGPPLKVRLSPEETEQIISPFGFVKDRLTDLGPFHYLITASFAKK